MGWAFTAASGVDSIGEAALPLLASAGVDIISSASGTEPCASSCTALQLLKRDASVIFNPAMSKMLRSLHPAYKEVFVRYQLERDPAKACHSHSSSLICSGTVEK